MTSSPSAPNRDFNQSSANGMSASGTGPLTSGNTNAALNAHPSQRSVPSVDEESPLLCLGAGRMQHLLGDLQNRGSSGSRSQDSIHPPQHLDRSVVPLTNSTANTSTSNPSIPDQLPFLMENSRRIHSDGSIPMSTSSPPFLSPPNLQPTAPPVFETQSSQRRRRRNRPRMNSSSSNIETQASATSLSSSHSNLRHSTPAASTTETAVESHARRGSGNNSLRASLDAGMAAVQRWIRSRSGSATTASEPSSSGRSVTWSNARESLSEVVSLSSRSAGIGHHGDEESFAGQRSVAQVYHPTIFEEDEDALGRQRALSESDAVGIRDFLRTMRRGGQARQRRGRTGGNSENNNARQLSSSAAAALHITTDRTPTTNDGGGPPAAQTQNLQIRPAEFLFAPSPGPTPSLRERSVTDGGLDSYRYMEPLETTGPFVVDEASSVSTETSEGTGGDSERRARARWIQINRRFQFVITAVALLFSLLLFGILICWVVLTSAYVVSFDKSCDVPLKPYFWLVTFQLVLDVFRTDIMRFVFNWDSSSNQRIPTRVIVYNVTYLLYAMLVLRLGIQSVYVNSDADCRDTAPELFNACFAFVSLSLAAWGTIICGYLMPFFVVAGLLTCNGYNPSSDAQQNAGGGTQPVFPAAYATTGAPPGTVELLHKIQIDDFPDDYPRECCICMETFGRRTIVETSCKHVFHKQCCREWLRQARSCPVCRMDIPLALERSDRPTSPSEGSNAEETPTEAPRIPIGPTGRPVVGLLRVLRTQSISFGANSQSGSG
uniref:RING-type domain-containing protein n=1 Tax=Amphora coffeiformis TaxID=265554 RepID=A0A7S3L0S7_9STRA